MADHTATMLTWQSCRRLTALCADRPDLELSVLTDDDIPGLVELALEGLHAPDEMPFWRPGRTCRRKCCRPTWSPLLMLRASPTPSHLDLPFTVRVPGSVGMQNLGSVDFASPGRRRPARGWPSLPGRGIGTRIRASFFSLAFDGLVAAEVTPAPFSTPRLAPSAAGRRPPQRRGAAKASAGEVAMNQRLVLTLDTLVRRARGQDDRRAGLLRFFDLDRSRHSSRRASSPARDHPLSLTPGAGSGRRSSPEWCAPSAHSCSASSCPGRGPVRRLGAASSTRFVAPVLRSMLEMWELTVFSLSTSFQRSRVGPAGHEMARISFSRGVRPAVPWRRAAGEARLIRAARASRSPDRAPGWAPSRRDRLGGDRSAPAAA